MHGIIKPHSADALVERQHWSEKLRVWSWRNKWFLAIVVVPTLLAALYYYIVAADQYQSEAHFIVRTADASPMPTSGFSQFLGLGGGMSPSRGEAMSVNDYLDSQQVVNRIDDKLNLVERFRRPEADIATRLWFSQPTPEMLLRYYRRQVNVKYNQETGITTLQVRAFRPSDSFAIINELLALGEGRVNEINRRSQTDQLASARRQLAEHDFQRMQAAGGSTDGDHAAWFLRRGHGGGRCGRRRRRPGSRRRRWCWTGIPCCPGTGSPC